MLWQSCSIPSCFSLPICEMGTIRNPAYDHLGRALGAGTGQAASNVPYYVISNSNGADLCLSTCKEAHDSVE